MTDIPTDAERVAFDAVFGTRKVPSKFAPGMQALVPTMRCLGCNTTYDDSGVGHTLKCNCGLSTQYSVTGSVFIWRDAPATAERVP